MADAVIPYGNVYAPEIYLNNAFYLYYAEAKCHVPDCSGVVPALRGIALAASYDGHNSSRSARNQSFSNRPPIRLWFAGDNAREAADNLDTLVIGIGVATRSD